MELASGYLLIEAEKQQRTYESWKEELENSGVGQDWRIEAMVSDGAQALIKLADKGLSCTSVPDLFHALRA